MKTLFAKTTCPHCGQKYDPAKGECPFCHTKNDLPERGHGWEGVTPTGIGEEIALFLTGSLGLTLVAILLSYVIQSLAKSAFASEGFSGEALLSAMEGFVTTTAYSAYVNLGTYLVLFTLLLFVLGRNVYLLTAKFRKGSTYWGILIGFGMMIITAILSASLGVKPNPNETRVESIESFAPYASLVIVGLIGPFCEEVTYRVGLYTVLKRFNWVVALVVTSLVFTFIHFDFSNIASLNEWINVPIYLSMAVILTWTYEKFGFGASFLAHATNNFVGVLLAILLGSLR